MGVPRRIIENNTGRSLKESNSSSPIPKQNSNTSMSFLADGLPKSMQRRRFLPLWAQRAATGWTWRELGLHLDCHLYPNHIHKLFAQEQSLPFLMDSLFQSLDWSNRVQISSRPSTSAKKSWKGGKRSRLPLLCSLSDWMDLRDGGCMQTSFVLATQDFLAVLSDLTSRGYSHWHSTHTPKTEAQVSLQLIASCSLLPRVTQST